MAGKLRVLMIAFVAIVLICILAGVYFYQFYSFKTLRICVSQNAKDTMIICSSDKYCVDKINDEIPEIKNLYKINSVIIQQEIEKIFGEIAYCESTCRVREVRGLEEKGGIDSCSADEKEFVFEITGKEGLEVLKNLKEAA